MNAINWTLFHMPLSRSTRVLWTWKELELIYGSEMPKLTVARFDRSKFRTEKPDWYVDVNPNQKVPCLICSHDPIFKEDDVKISRHTKVLDFKPSLVLIESAACVLSLLRRFDAKCSIWSKDETDLTWQAAFYCAGTADNLTATSSPFQGVINMSSQSSSSVRNATRAAGWNDDMRREAWTRLCAPTMLRFLDQQSSKEFSAIDLFVGMPLFWLDQKKQWLADVPELEAYYHERIEHCPAFRDAISDAPPQGFN